ncbi:PP80 [Orf virus]|uniref:PP80 n=1 Tax=Orf virus TaxID=10258 RepID=F1AX53_ORFV|nr:PP80 [Orf virus]
MWAASVRALPSVEKLLRMPAACTSVSTDERAFTRWVRSLKSARMVENATMRSESSISSALSMSLGLRALAPPSVSPDSSLLSTSLPLGSSSLSSEGHGFFAPLVDLSDLSALSFFTGRRLGVLAGGSGTVSGTGNCSWSSSCSASSQGQGPSMSRHSSPLGKRSSRGSWQSLPKASERRRLRRSSRVWTLLEPEHLLILSRHEDMPDLDALFCGAYFQYRSF